MYCIDILIEEHDNILRLNKVILEASKKALINNKINIEDFEKIIKFIKNYSDKHHHLKEEDILFTEIIKLGDLGEKLINHGMLIEHDYGRLYVFQVEENLNLYKKNKSPENLLQIISNAVSYTNLLNRHAEKENVAVFTFAEKMLDKNILEELNIKSKIFEEKAEEKNIQKYYLNILNELENKYL